MSYVSCMYSCQLRQAFLCTIFVPQPPEIITANSYNKAVIGLVSKVGLSDLNYTEYKYVIENIPYTDSLKYQLAIFWLHSEHLPVGVISVGETASGIVKIPGIIFNKAGYRVPVIEIKENAFANHDRITDVVLPSCMERIRAGAFSGCSELRRITIPRKIKSIQEGTFAGCDNLENVYYEGTLEEWKNISIVHRKHEIEFDGLIPGTPVQKIIAERLVHIPGNDALLKANIHFHCSLPALEQDSEYIIRMGNKDVTALFIAVEKGE